MTEHPDQRPIQPPPRPAWTLTAAQTLTELDQLHETLTRLTARRLELLAHLDHLGHARDLGARDTTELISLRHRLDPHQVRRDLRIATSLRTLPVVATQLPGYPTPTPTAATSAGTTQADAVPPADDTTADDVTAGTASAAAFTEAATAKAGLGSECGDDPVAVLVDRRRTALAREVTLNSAQAAVIAETLAKVPAHIPGADVAVAETELVIAARTLLPRDLRRLARGVLDRLDTDGPPPAGAHTSPDANTSADASPEADAAGLDAARIDPAEAAHLAETLWWQPASVPNPAWATNPAGTPRRVQGLRFGGFVTGENAELFQTLVDAAAKPRKTPSGELDPRTLGQRRADAFAIVLRAAAATGGEIPAHGGIKPHVSVTIPYTTLTTSLRPDAHPLTNRGSAPAPGPLTDVDSAACIGPLTNVDSAACIGPIADVDSDPPAGPLANRGPGSVAGPLVDLSPGSVAGLGSNPSATGSLVFGEPLAAGEVRRIACDAGIIPIMLGARSEPLDVGREQRLVTPAIRRALIARDGGCVIPGCGAPPGHCDAHHLIHWVDGGITAVSNLALVCPTHHRAIHRGIWTVTIVDGQVRITRPDWTEPGPSG